MKSNYKQLGNFIRLVNERDVNLSVKLLLGVSIQKKFIPSIANIIGTDMSTYKIIKRNQFAYGPVTSRNGDKISIALMDEFNEAIISQAYISFEIIDNNELLPEYLMMWFRRTEFDRYARFKSHGSAREIFEWQDMCETTLPVPDIEKQKEIVKEYYTIINRISINNELIQKLEETAQAIYKQWFVDFEFPDEDGKPFKSSGGEMVESELGDLPKGWKVMSIKEFSKEIKSGGTPNRDEPEYWNSRDIPWLKTGEVANKVLVDADEYISYKGCQNSSAKLIAKNSVLIAMYGDGKTKGQSAYLRFDATTNQACCSIACNNENDSSFLYYYFRLNQARIANLANGGAQPNLSKNLIENIRFIKADEETLRKHNLLKFINHSESLERENLILEKFCALILSKLATIEN